MTSNQPGGNKERGSGGQAQGRGNKGEKTRKENNLTLGEEIRRWKILNAGKPVKIKPKDATLDVLAQTLSIGDNHTWTTNMEDGTWCKAALKICFTKKPKQMQIVVTSRPKKGEEVRLRSIFTFSDIRDLKITTAENGITTVTIKTRIPCQFEKGIKSKTPDGNPTVFWKGLQLGELEFQKEGNNTNINVITATFKSPTWKPEFNDKIASDPHLAKLLKKSSNSSEEDSESSESDQTEQKNEKEDAETKADTKKRKKFKAKRRQHGKGNTQQNAQKPGEGKNKQSQNKQNSPKPQKKQKGEWKQKSRSSLESSEQSQASKPSKKRKRNDKTKFQQNKQNDGKQHQNKANSGKPPAKKRKLNGKDKNNKE